MATYVAKAPIIFWVYIDIPSECPLTCHICALSSPQNDLKNEPPKDMYKGLVLKCKPQARPPDQCQSLHRHRASRLHQWRCLWRRLHHHVAWTN